jgi:transcriptional regulator with XRE-family HTH domain
MPSDQDYSYEEENELDRARRSRRKRPRSAPAPLALLLEEYNAALGWTQIKLAEEVGKDVADINKIFTGITRRPHYTTLKRIAHAYQRAGLANVTAELLEQARDREYLTESASDGIPPQWRRLIRRVLAHGEEVQDSFFRKWSLDFHETIVLMSRATSFQPSDPSDDEIDSAVLGLEE